MNYSWISVTEISAIYVHQCSCRSLVRCTLIIHRYLFYSHFIRPDKTEWKGNYSCIKYIKRKDKMVQRGNVRWTEEQCFPGSHLLFFPSLPRQRKRATKTQQRTKRLKHSFRAEHRIHGLKESGDLRIMARQIAIHFSLFFFVLIIFGIQCNFLQWFLN